jgi:hypothetical protein
MWKTFTWKCTSHIWNCIFTTEEHSHLKIEFSVFKCCHVSSHGIPCWNVASPSCHIYFTWDHVFTYSFMLTRCIHMSHVITLTSHKITWSRDIYLFFLKDNFLFFKYFAVIAVTELSWLHWPLSQFYYSLYVLLHYHESGIYVIVGVLLMEHHVVLVPYYTNGSLVSGHTQTGLLTTQQSRVFRSSFWSGVIY